MRVLYGGSHIRTLGPFFGDFAKTHFRARASCLSSPMVALQKSDQNRLVFSPFDQ